VPPPHPPHGSAATHLDRIDPTDRLTGPLSRLDGADHDGGGAGAAGRWPRSENHDRPHAIRKIERVLRLPPARAPCSQILDVPSHLDVTSGEAVEVGQEMIQEHLVGAGRVHAMTRRLATPTTARARAPIMV